MRLKRSACLGLVLWLTVARLSISAEPLATPSKVYVTDFSSRTISDKELLESFSDLFETALKAGERFKILNRRTLYRILSEAQNEGTLTSMHDVNQRARTQLARAQMAEGVIFGAITDDQVSGQIRATVSLQSFDTEIHCQAATTMTRGKLFDLASRQDLMERLATEICQAPKPTGGQAGTSQPDQTRSEREELQIALKHLQTAMMNDDWAMINHYTLYSGSASMVEKMQKDVAELRAQGASFQMRLQSFSIESVGQGNAKVRMEMELVMSTPSEYIRGLQAGLTNFKKVGGVWKQGDGTPIGEIRVLEHRRR